jgi:hypothetical protein
MNRKTGGLTVAAVVTGILGGAYGGYLLERHDPGGSQFVSVAAPASTNPVRITYSGAGLYLVPSQFAAGTYMVTAGAGDFGCYWERLKALDGRKASILSSGDASRGGYGRLVVSATDRAVRMVGDCVWVKL